VSVRGEGYPLRQVCGYSVSRMSPGAFGRSACMPPSASANGAQREEGRSGVTVCEHSARICRSIPPLLGDDRTARNDTLAAAALEGFSSSMTFSFACVASGNHREQTNHTAILGIINHETDPNRG